MVMAKGDRGKVVFQDGGCFFEIFKTRANQQPDTYILFKPHPNVINVWLLIRFCFKNLNKQPPT